MPKTATQDAFVPPEELIPQRTKPRPIKSSGYWRAPGIKATEAGASREPQGHDPRVAIEAFYPGFDQMDSKTHGLGPHRSFFEPRLPAPDPVGGPPTEEGPLPV